MGVLALTSAMWFMGHILNARKVIMKLQIILFQAVVMSRIYVQCWWQKHGHTKSTNNLCTACLVVPGVSFPVCRLQSWRFQRKNLVITFEILNECTVVVSEFSHAFPSLVFLFFFFSVISLLLFLCFHQLINDNYINYLFKCILVWLALLHVPFDRGVLYQVELTRK